MKILIFGTVYAGDEKAEWLAQKWADVHRKVNADYDVDYVLIDSASPRPLPSTVRIVQLGDNIGHFSKNGRDGWGRSFCVGLNMTKGYDYVVHLEGDLLFAWPVLTAMIQPMQRAGKMVAAPTSDQYGWIETAMMAFDARWLEDFDLAGRYNWPMTGILPGLPEQRIQNLVKDVWLPLTIPGGRAEGRDILAKSAWLTHDTIMNTQRFLRSHSLD